MKTGSGRHDTKGAKRRTALTAVPPKKGGVAGVGVMSAANSVTKNVLRLPDGSKFTMFVPSAETSDLKQKVAATKGLQISQFAAGYKVVRRGGRGVETTAAPLHARDQSSDQILDMASNLAGSKAKAENWYRTFPIPAFGGVTAEFLVDNGRAKEVRAYLNAVVLGEFA